MLRPFSQAVTYTRWLHLFMAVVWPAMWIFVDEAWALVSVVPLAAAGLVPGMRVVEGVQARLLLTGHRPDDASTDIVVAPSATWADRGRTVLWLEARLLIGSCVAMLTVQLPVLAVDLVHVARGGRQGDGSVRPPRGRPLVVRPARAAAGPAARRGRRRLRGADHPARPPPAGTVRRRTALRLEERTEQLLERNRIARELHDSIGHALTVAVVQAGAAGRRTARSSPTGRLTAIEETGRAALEDLERVLGVLRESERPASGRPTLADADRLLESARASGAKVDAEVAGPLETLPGHVSREGYRILQESLTNVLRHAGAVPTRVRVEVADGVLTLDVRNPLRDARAAPGRGAGLRGIRERAALLGGRAHAGPDGAGEWKVRVELPPG
ncbi:sensor histidine kinase [Streptomyces violaceorubidus]